MLQSLRDNLKGSVAVIVVALMVVPLVLFGVDSLFVGSGSAPEVAEVNGEVITEAELQQAIFFRQNQMRSQFGDNLPEQFVSEENLRGPVLDSLIKRRLLAQSAKDGGMVASDQRINQMIVSAPEFQTDGKFDPELYSRRVYNVGYTPSSYRRRLAEDMVLNQYVSGLTASSFVTQAALERTTALSQQERDFYYLTVPAAPVEAEIEVDEARAQAYYEAHKSEFRNPEQVSIEYLEVNLNEIAANIEIPKEQLREQYAQEVAAFDANVQRRAAHILIEPKPDGDEQTVLQEIQTRLEAGEDFAALAEEYSEDLGSKSVGGDLGFTSGDTFPDAFEDALAGLEVGEVSQPVETEAGYHLIKLKDVQGAKPPSFEQDRARIANALKRAEAQDRFALLLQDLEDATYNSQDLADAGETLGVEHKVAGPFSRSAGFGIASKPAVLEAAFSDEVLVDGHTSPVLELGPDHALVLRVTEHQEPRTLSFEEVRTEVERSLKREMAVARIAEIGSQLEADIASGKTVEEVAKAKDYEWQVSLDTQRNASRVKREILEHVFSLPRPQGQAVTSGFTTSAGDYVVASLTEVSDGDYQNMSQSEKTNLRQRLASSAGESAYLAYEAQLQQTAKIEGL